MLITIVKNHRRANPHKGCLRNLEERGSALNEKGEEQTCMPILETA